MMNVTIHISHFFQPKKLVLPSCTFFNIIFVLITKGRFKTLHVNSGSFLDLFTYQN